MPSLREQIIPRRKLLLITSECVIFTGTLFVGTSLTPLASNPDFVLDLQSSDTLRFLMSCLAIAFLCQACLSYNDLYDWRVSQNRGELKNRLLHSGGYTLVLLAILVFLLPALFHFPSLRNAGRETWKIIALLGCSYGSIYGFRAGFHWFFYKWNFGEQVLILGTGNQAKEIADLINDNPMSGYEVVGLVDENNQVRSDPGCPPHHEVLGGIQDLEALGQKHRVARVVVALKERRGTLPIGQLLAARMNGIHVEEREAMFERVAGKMSIESLRPSYLIFGSGFSNPPLAIATKRISDLLVVTVGLVLSAPIMLLVSILIKLESRGPILFRQERVGQDGHIFTVLKFRTMRVDAEQESGPVWATAEDPRVTRIGKWLRLSRIDEIPQMLNVLAGQMSFVGPRPERPFFVDELSSTIKFYPLRLTVKPGVTGWAQVNLAYAASIEDTMEKLRFDLYYIKNMGLLFDLNIIARTVGVILFGKGAR